MRSTKVSVRACMHVSPGKMGLSPSGGWLYLREGKLSLQTSSFLGILRRGKVAAHLSREGELRNFHYFLGREYSGEGKVAGSSKNRRST